MNDYKELIEDLRLGLTCGPYRAVTVLKSMLSEAADAIEQLVKERDAAVADIPHACGYCKWYVESDDECVRMFTCNNISGVNTGWEWRGVQEVEHEAD